MTNSIYSRTESEVFGAIILNTLLPLLMFFISYSLYKTQVKLFLSKMSEAISHMEMKKILKMIPQALFFIDETNEEILHQSDAMLTFFG